MNDSGLCLPPEGFSCAGCARDEALSGRRHARAGLDAARLADHRVGCLVRGGACHIGSAQRFRALRIGRGIGCRRAGRADRAGAARAGAGALLGVALVLFAAVLGWWFSLEPSNDRDWVAENARLAYAAIEGDIVTVHNIRNFDYRSETDFTPAWYDKRFDLRRLEGVDLVAVYWMGPAIAHIFVSFAFAGGDHLAVSIETRKEKGEGYSTVKGSFASTSCTTSWPTSAT